MWNNESRIRSQEQRHISSSDLDRLISMEIFDRVLEQVQTTAHTMQFYFQGEPLLNKQLPEMIARAHHAGLYTIVSTNAQALDKKMADALVKSGLSQIIVSIDGFSEESYTAYRVGGSLHKALEGLLFLRQAKDNWHSPIRIELQVLRLRSNEHEWQWIQRNYKQLGATHLVFKTAQLYDYEHGNSLMPRNERYSRYKKGADGTYRLYRSWMRKKWKVNPCFRLWSGCVISTTGEVLPCCYDKEHQYPLGNVMNQSIANIFQSEKANMLRNKVLTDKNHLPKMCKNCNY
jgi:radical SAM protein with 4Fe4S-binding SPASM domain